MKQVLNKHWRRLKRSLGRRYREWRLPHGYVRLGTRYGGWWIDRRAISEKPLLIDCGLGVDISFPTAFIAEFGGQVIGIDPHPASVSYCEAHKPAGMQVWQRAFWREAGQRLTFHMPKSADQLPKGADNISGSLLESHSYTGEANVAVLTTSLQEILAATSRDECDILKLDIEGAEYDVLDELCRSGSIRKAKQVLVEFHHKWTHHPFEDTLAAVDLMQRSGFRLVHTEDRNYIFRRTDLG